MLRITRTLASSLALLVVIAISAPTTAHAWPIGKLFHIHPGTGQAQDTRIDVHLYNKGNQFQDVQVGGHVYTVLPQHGLWIKAPAGTSVYAASTGMGHRKGDLLVAVTPEVKDQIIYFN